MKETYNAEYVSLHVRKSNRAALGLYTDTLGFVNKGIEAKYYADHEDAYEMEKSLLTPEEEAARKKGDSEGEKKSSKVKAITGGEVGKEEGTEGEAPKKLSKAARRRAARKAARN
eukprot:CAMPEP_0117026350 /NCGR_PEP_ID=MMETSP0472-20121206/19385_1 /TAXON_ID=693140 ORGANISM="Tiarina fusus, Strain LIS" /NCGR_SAMPLE_ID=MMETSP0472 /ASSEMBLY_ACC=CAM_ASM_000603 /LENGTH=114 /DNA_ID=CAMNT_0004733341 /DNA_START=301 /DNA_END=645 /DNA_ORIENTATION=+